MASKPKLRYTVEQYLEWEREAEYKHEFIDGQIVAMTGASRPHNLISMNIGGELRNLLKGSDCENYASDMRVAIPSRKLYTYPDGVVVCGEPEFEETKGLDTLLNPAVLVEVLSPSTESYDRGQKFVYYRTIPSLREYVLVAQDEVLVDHYVRQNEGGWLLHSYTDLGDAIHLPSLDASLPLSEIYYRVTFEPTDDDKEQPEEHR